MKNPREDGEGTTDSGLKRYISGRVPAIDLMRGVSIIGMLFFSLNYTLTDDLPVLLMHNVPERFLPGDLVLPLFLFTSGLAVSAAQRSPRGAPQMLSFRLVCRVMVQLVIALGLSRFSSGRIGGMDEMMLNLIIWIPVSMFAHSTKMLVAISLLSFGLYPVLELVDMLPIRSDRYLGGYGAALFYLPVMALGVLLSRNRVSSAGRNLKILASLFSFLLLVASVALWPIRKLEVTPSFVMVSCVGSVAVWQIAARVRCRWLEFVGRFPRTSWIFMFVALIIPLQLIEQHRAIVLPWWAACLAALSSVLVLSLVLRMTTVIEKRWRLVEGSRHEHQHILATPFPTESSPSSFSRLAG